jgi:hypothetical protein
LDVSAMWRLGVFRVIALPMGNGSLYRSMEWRKANQVPLNGGTPQRVIEVPVLSGFDIFPDGGLAAFATFAGRSNPKTVLALVPVDFPQNAKFLAMQRPRSNVIRFSHDGKAVVYTFHDWFPPAPC